MAHPRGADVSAWIEGDLLLERDCPRCKGSGIDSIRIGFAHDRFHCDPDWCSECGGVGTEHVDLACLLLNLWVAIGLAAAAAGVREAVEDALRSELEDRGPRGHGANTSMVSAVHKRLGWERRFEQPITHLVNGMNGTLTACGLPSVGRSTVLHRACVLPSRRLCEACHQRAVSP